jgi:hypothetical protein
MEFQLPIRIDPPSRLIDYRDPIMLTGSCFTEHIGNTLQELKFDTLQNPNGILFDPASVAGSLVSYIHNKQYGEDELVYFNEVWQSWQHHSVFSHTDRAACLAAINASQTRAHHFLKKAKWLIITLGTSFSYRLTNEAGADANPIANPIANLDAHPDACPDARPHARPVANCHRAPAQDFQKHLMTIGEIESALEDCLRQLFHYNVNLQVIFTVSPVRHIRDGVIENNRSKARLIEAVHHLVNAFDKVNYFPAYELVVDVLRDYRFYDADLVHPNYQATHFVLEKFIRHFVDPSSQQIMEEIKKIVIARKHKPFQPSTQAHKRFLQDHWQKTNELALRYPFLDLTGELAFFSAGADDSSAGANDSSTGAARSDPD